ARLLITCGADLERARSAVLAGDALDEPVTEDWQAKARRIARFQRETRRAGGLSLMVRAWLMPTLVVLLVISRSVSPLLVPLAVSGACLALAYRWRHLRHLRLALAPAPAEEQSEALVPLLWDPSDETRRVAAQLLRELGVPQQLIDRVNYRCAQAMVQPA